MGSFLRWVAPVLLLSGELQLCSETGWAQLAGSDKPPMLLMNTGEGAIVLPTGKGWKLESLTVYDHGQRPVALYKWGEGAMDVSFILFENRSGEANGRGCRADAIGAIVTRLGDLISRRLDAEARSEGGELASTSYLIEMRPDAPGHFQRNLFGFAGSEKTCVEIHVSAVSETVTDEAMKARFGDFHFDLRYHPGPLDYFRLASMLFKGSPGLAAPYYRSALDAMPRDDSYKALRRIATDQLVMSLGMSGDVKNSRAVAEAAIQADPEYPLNYYNLACADAEQGDAAQAKLHLQQAFERRAHVLPGESMPDPTRDDSILKLKNDKAFWDWVQTLPRK